MIRRAAMALAMLCVSLAGSASAQQLPEAMSRWTEANQRAIAHTRAPKARRAQEQIFRETQREMLRMRNERVAGDAVNARAQAVKILANHRVFVFGEVQKPPPKTWWDRFRDWLGERWAAAFKALFGRVRLSGTASLAIGDVLLTVSIVMFLGLLGRVVWLYGRRTSGAHGVPRVLDSAQDPAQLSARAGTAADREDYALAVSLLFAAALILLHACGAFAGAPSETVGEMRRSVRSTHRRFSEDFDELASALTLSVYADARIDAERYRRARAAYESIVRATGVSRAA